MQNNNFYAHDNPTGQTPLDRIQDAGYPAIDVESCRCDIHALIGENIAKGQAGAWTVVSAWMDSPEHRKNILSPDLKEIGIGIADGIWVQNFGGVHITTISALAQ